MIVPPRDFLQTADGSMTTLAKDGHDGRRTTPPKTDEAAACNRSVPAAEGRAGLRRTVGPGPAARHAGHTAAPFPRRAILRCAVVGVGPSILAPFPHVVVHVVKAGGIGRERSHRHGFPSGFTFGRAVVGVIAIEVGLVRGDACAEMEWRIRSGPARILPFRLAGQPEAAPAPPGMRARTGRFIERLAPMTSSRVTLCFEPQVTRADQALCRADPSI